MGQMCRRAAGTTAAAVVAALVAVPTAAMAAPTAAGAPTRVLVTGRSGQGDVVRSDVLRLGGRVVHALPVIDGVLAELPAGRVDRLRAAAGVRSVSGDGAGRLLSVDPALGYDVAGDDGSLYDIGQVTHARDVWAKNVTGKGVDVALIDSGVVPVQGLTSGNVVQGPDLSLEVSDPALVHKDTFGHGTHMASIIAGRDAPASGAAYAKADSHSYNGIAPDARLISLKVAAHDGAADVSQVIAAIDWVTQHAHDPGMNIRVVNLSYGTDSVQDPTLDPLVYAAENAWRAGIVVVAASGNDGTNRAALADPAISPLVLAVGADDPMGTDQVSDDTVPAFAQRGTADRPVDLVAPGVHVLGLRDPGSSIDTANPSARVGSRFFRGSGTSQSAAVVSGLAALYLSKYPAATPDQVKAALMLSAVAPSRGKRTFTGTGVPDMTKAVSLSPLPVSQARTGATGLGTLEGARGSAHLDDGIAPLVGEFDIFGQPWVAGTWAPLSAARTAWTGGSWNGSDWTGTGWTGPAGALVWDSHSWSGSSWSGSSWSGSSWSGSSWSGSSWSGSTWSGSTWSGSSWSGSTWSGSTWSDSSWN